MPSSASLSITFLEIVVAKHTAADRARIMQEYSLAYEAANPGKRATVTYERGWVSVKGDHHMPPNKYRIATLVEMTERLKARMRRWVVVAYPKHEVGVTPWYLKENGLWVHSVRQDEAQRHTDHVTAVKIAMEKDEQMENHNVVAQEVAWA